MKKLILLALLLLPSWGFAQSPSVIARVSDSVVYINWAQGETGSSCTGFIVGLRWVLTAEHCLPPVGANIDIYVDEVAVHVLKRNDMLALLEFDAGSHRVLSLRKAPLRVGETVASLGFAWGEPLHVFRRSVAAIAKDEHVIIDGDIAPGMSGGPLVDENGEVVGINQGRNGTVGIACGAKELRDFIK